jgi:hypothetical protein
VDVFDLEVNSRDPNDVIKVCQLLEPTFGGINLEDIKAPECFHVEEALNKTLSIPVFHDDQHGTAHNQLGVKGPYRCITGVEDILDRHLREDNFQRKSGLCSVPTIEVEEFFKLGDDPRDVLEPFFEEVFDKCGQTRGLRAAVT